MAELKLVLPLACKNNGIQIGTGTDDVGILSGGLALGDGPLDQGMMDADFKSCSDMAHRRVLDELSVPKQGPFLGAPKILVEDKLHANYSPGGRMANPRYRRIDAMHDALTSCMS